VHVIKVGQVVQHRGIAVCANFDTAYFPAKHFCSKNKTSCREKGENGIY
jgi:hypothetical protein